MCERADDRGAGVRRNRDARRGLVAGPLFEGNGFSFSATGFSARADLESLVGIYYTSEQPGCDPCRAAETWNPSFTSTNVSMGTGPATYGGTSYSRVTFYGDLNFSVTPIAFPAVAGDYVTVSSPFTFTGALRAFDGSNLLFSTDLVGTGNAIRSFDRYFDGTQTLFYGGENRQVYIFTNTESAAATPEPASMLLLGTGLAGLVARRRHRRAAP